MGSVPRVTGAVISAGRSRPVEIQRVAVQTPPARMATRRASFHASATNRGVRPRFLGNASFGASTTVFGSSTTVSPLRLGGPAGLVSDWGGLLGFVVVLMDG